MTKEFAITCDNVLKSMRVMPHQGGNAVQVTEFVKDRHGYEFTFVVMAMDILSIRELIQRVSNTTSYKITIRGRSFHTNDSFLKQYERELLKIEREGKDEEIKDQSYKLNEWLLKTKWWPLIISGIALIVSVIALLYAIRSYNSEIQQRQEKILKESRIE